MLERRALHSRCLSGLGVTAGKRYSSRAEGSLVRRSGNGRTAFGVSAPTPAHTRSLKFIIRFIFLFPPLDLSPWQQSSQLHFISFSANLSLCPPTQSLFSHPPLVCSSRGAGCSPVSPLSCPRLLCPSSCADLFLGTLSHLSLH